MKTNHFPIYQHLWNVPGSTQCVLCVCVCPLCHLYSKSGILTIHGSCCWESRLFKCSFSLAIPSRAPGWGKKGRQDAEAENEGSHISSELCLLWGALLCAVGPPSKSSPTLYCWHPPARPCREDPMLLLVLPWSSHGSWALRGAGDWEVGPRSGQEGTSQSLGSATLSGTLAHQPDLCIHGACLKGAVLSLPPVHLPSRSCHLVGPWASCESVGVTGYLCLCPHIVQGPSEGQLSRQWPWSIESHLTHVKRLGRHSRAVRVGNFSRMEKKKRKKTRGQVSNSVRVFWKVLPEETGRKLLPPDTAGSPVWMSF